MKNKLLSLILMLCIILALIPAASAAEPGGIVVLFTSDVHCAVDEAIGYAGLAAYEKEMSEIYGEDNVTLVDAGDAVQGGAIGTLSKGKFLVDIMNKVGYDVVTPGNHEFDYGMAQMLELMKLHNATVVSCNFIDLNKGGTVFEPYTIIDYGDKQVAYIGITTPRTFTSSTPTYFQDKSGNYIYSFKENEYGHELYDTVQASVDKAINEGADVVIAIGHCGSGEEYTPWQSTQIIANTIGIDAFIDGHSHSVIEGELYKNKDGEEVPLAAVGTKLANIGKLLINPDGTISIELISEYNKKDADVEAYIKEIQAENEKLLNTVVAKSDVALVIDDPKTGIRLIRNSETNLGDLAADAYRTLLGADVAVVNGGGIRANIAAGDITYNDIISVHPFGNTACVVEATGQEILDLLEMGARNTPSESGGFMQVSGLTYEIHTYIESSVTLDEKGTFKSVDGPYRVQNVMIGQWPLDLSKTYTLASHNYLIKSGGDGYAEFMDNKLLQDEVMIDNQVLITYIVDKLGGKVDKQYSNIYGQGRIEIKVSPFTDLIPGAWYYDPVIYVFNRGIMTGTSDTEFTPDDKITRASFITTLYRLAGSPKTEGKASLLFKDCLDNEWYSDAIVWASKQNILADIKEPSFRPDDKLTREDMALFLYRYIQSKGGGFKGLWAYKLDYKDSSDISEQAYEAVAYCTQSGILTGSSGMFRPRDTATRAMTAAIIQRYELQTAEKELDAAA